MTEEHDDVLNQLMKQLEAFKPQMDTINTFLLVMSRKTDIKKMAETIKVNRADLEDMRSNVLDMLLEYSKMLDVEAAKAGLIGTTITENGVGIFTCERMTRLSINLLNEMSPEEATLRAGFKVEVAKHIRERFERKLLYIAALALTDFPKLTVPELFRHMLNPFNFILWHNDASAFLEQDAKAVEARLKKERDNIDEPN